VTPENITDDALSTLAEWLPGYTFPNSGPQSRIRMTGGDDDSITVEYETPANGGDTATFRIRVEVTEVQP